MEKIVALSCVFGLGMCFSLLGSISVKLMPRLKIDQGKFGSLISAFMFSCLVGSLVMGVLIDAIGYMPVPIFGFVITAICIFAFARTTNYSTAVLLCCMLGFGAMALNSAGNTLIPVVLFGGQNPAGASNLGNVFFGLGLFLTPLIVSVLFRETTYENAVSALGLIVLVPVIFALKATYREFPNVSAGFSLGAAVQLLAEPAVLLAALVLFCYISLESSFCNWLPAFGKEVINIETPGADPDAVDASAQRLLSLFAIAMMAGRLIASQIPAITAAGTWFIAGAAIVAGLIIFAMTTCKSAGLARVLALLAGLAFAPCFPTTVGVMISKHPENFGSVFGIIFAVGLAGAVIVPKAIGNLAKGSSVQKGLKLLLPACAVLVILALVWKNV
jgi:fucose permease